MPLPKRQVEPIHVSRNTLPGDMPVPSELEAVTNGTLANTVRQLSSLSRHAEDLFGELQKEAATLAARATSVQSRIDRLAVKVTQLDSGGEEGTPDLLPPHHQQKPLLSLQDMHLRKAFKSSVIFDQQVVSRDTMPSAMLEQYMQCDKPPPLQKLNPYREDGKDGLKFYTDPNYFFDLWRQEMLKDTERMMHDRGKKPHRPRGAEGGRQHKKRVRQPHNTRERQRQVAMGQGEYLMPEANSYRSSKAGSYEEDMIDQRPPRPSSIELRSNYSENDHGGGMHPQHHMLNQDNDPYGRSNYQPGYNMHTAMYIQQQQQQQQQQQHVIYARGMNMQDPYGHTVDNRQSVRSNSIPQNGPGTPGQRPSQPPPAPPSTNNSESNTPTTLSASGTPTRGRSMSATRDTLPPPPPPPNDMVTSPQSNGSIPSHMRSQMRSSMSPPRTASPHNHMDHDYLPPPPPAPEEHSAPPSPPPAPSPPSAAVPPPPPPPPPAGASETGLHHIMANGDVNKVILKSPPKKAPPAPKPVDPRSDLLKAIRDGITLRKVEKSEMKEVEKSNALHDVASILARRVAVEFSDSESGSDSEESDGWEEEGGGTAANAT
ncbi:actin-binding protein WASF3 isoform X2 [Cloeon dipterum]|uniref:actin-binding protein WASF3 isoform X2 n=1 Tax=Cloeon dipterum TaxID=197152 RepID=UPI00321FBB48